MHRVLLCLFVVFLLGGIFFLFMVNTGLFVYGQASDFDYSFFSEIESCGVSVVSLLSNIDVDYLD